MVTDNSLYMCMYVGVLCVCTCVYMYTYTYTSYIWQLTVPATTVLFEAMASMP